MSKDRKKLLHIHSSVNDKQPTPATLELGELGVNNAKGNAFISTKNSDGEVVRFSEDETIIGWMEQKEVFPYEGYMRGADESQVDGVTEQDLLDNKSNLIIKLNQVVPQDTDYSPYDEKVNGAKDIYGNLINPISSGDYKDGAGIAIDMSKYAMLGANPSFSSITTTCHTTLNGTTEINGKDDACGSKFSVEVADACIEASDTLNEYGVNHSNFGVSCDGTDISNDTTLKGKKVLIDSPSGDLTVDIQACNHISARTNDFVISECQDNAGKVEIETTDIKASADTTDINSCNEFKVSTDNFVIEQCNSGVTHIHSCSGITLESKNVILTDGDCGNGEVTIDTNDLCLVGEEKINVYGDETNVGLDCDDSKIATNSRVFGKGTLITTNSDSTKYASENNVEIVATNDIKETASHDICDQAANNATFYGAVKTNIGVNCDDTATAATTTVRGERVIVDATVGNLGLTAKQDILESAENDIIITADRHLCGTAGTSSTIYGVSKTNIGIDCDENLVSDETNVNGSDIKVYADELLCESGDVVSIFAGTTLHIGGKNCSESGGTANIIYERNPNIICATTVDGGLEEVYERSKLTISAETLSPESEVWKRYTFYQDGQALPTQIDIPKDHLIRSGYTAYGIVNSTTGKFTPCSSAGDSACTWYIALVINVFDPESGHADDETLYIPADNLVKDTVYVDSDNIYFSQHYDSVSGVNVVSADTKLSKLTLTHNGLTNEYDPTELNSRFDWTLPHSALTISYGENPSRTPGDVVYNTSSAVSAYIPTSVAHLQRGILTLQSGSTCEFSTATFDPSGNTTVNIPTCVGDLGRDTLKWSYGSPCSSSNDTYDPGSYRPDPSESGRVSCTAATKTIIIPKTINHLTNGAMSFDGETGEACSGSCLVINTDVCATGHTMAAQAFYTSSDKNLKENIQSLASYDYSKVDTVDFKVFNFKDDETKQKTYGVIAQDVQYAGLDEIVHHDDNGNLSVDYISLLILKMANMESKVRLLTDEVNRLREELSNK